MIQKFDTPARGRFLLHYWGTRGGGLRLFRESLLELLMTTDSTIVVSCRESHISDFNVEHRKRIVNYDPNFSNSKFITILNPFVRLRLYRKYNRFLVSNKISNVLICMSHPLDVSIRKRVPKLTKVWRVVHDLERHQGDLWPTNRTIRRFLEDDLLIALSQETYNALPREKTLLSSLARKNLTYLPLPPQESKMIPQRYILIVGRGGKYKGIKKTLQLAKQYGNLPVVVAGKVSAVKSKIVNQVGIYFLNRWLTDSEMEWLIKNTSILLCLYEEASQSGVVEQAKFWGVPIMVSSKGALPSQVNGRQNCAILHTSDSLEFSKKIKELVQHQNLPLNHNRGTTLIESIKPFLVFQDIDL